MSASLVGSEMCIRDRACSAPPLTPGCCDRSARQQHRAGELRSDNDGGSCLLYTSDAADDM
eukprot:11661596-Alexandrium_andersonii.AAC.1